MTRHTRDRLRRLIRRSALAWWAATLALGLLTASVVSGSLSRATTSAQRWGVTRSVWVVQTTLAAGDVIDPDAVSLARRPAAVIPSGALDGATSPVGEATRVTLQPGEVVLTERLAGRGARGIAAMLRPGHRAVAVPNDEAMPPLRVGDRVDVIATFDIGGEAGDVPAVAVASDAEVLAVTDGSFTLAVTDREAPRVAFALAKGALALALRGPAVSAQWQSR